jgi:membrane-associated phospholipid phosphatase
MTHRPIQPALDVDTTPPVAEAAGRSDDRPRAQAVLRVAQVDRRAFEWVAERQSRVLDAVMPRLTHMGDNGSLWAWAAVALALLGGQRGRRAARAGLLSLAIVSPVVNGPMKWIVRRPRPMIDVVPEARRIRTTPRTTSFPSGHSASAWCFSVAASIEAPILAPLLLPMAAAVAYSRVYTGAHYPGDAIAGSLVGAALGAGLGPHVSAFGARVDREGAKLIDLWARSAPAPAGMHHP